MSDSHTEDPKPAGESPAPSAKPEIWLPPRLREKLESAETGPGGADDWKPKRGSPLTAILTVVAILIVAVGAFAWWRSGARKEGRAEAHMSATETPASPAPASGAPDSTLASAPDTATASTAGAATSTTPGTPPAAAPSASAAASTGSTATASKPASAAPTTSAGAAAAAAAAPATPPPAATSGFGLLVGSYLFEDKANSERDRLIGVTGLPVIVNAATDDGGTSYRVILGKFSSRAQAEKKAGALIDSSLVAQAQVVARPK